MTRLFPKKTARSSPATPRESRRLTKAEKHPAIAGQF
jgi:hypothetical protein